ncbi:MAG: Gfo/Idh/MocA family oxidoreductase [Bacteroidetes bacterium]|nr:Gfo/Idh/MocA family oxidoreductase [Bacteroidota bacterium]
MKTHPFSRRDFLRTASVGAGALAFGNVLSSFAPKPNKKLGIALVGLGNYSTYQLAPALQQTKNCYLAGIVTGHPAKAEKWKHQYHIPDKNIYNYETYDQVKNNPDIDIIYVVLPVFMHKEYTIRGAEAGKHVICEKPMALNAKECGDMIAACKKADRLLSIGYRLHFEPHNMEVMRLGQQKVYGKVTSLDTGNGFTYRGDPNAWRLKKAMAGGGGLMDMGIYSIQASRYTLGQEPVAIKARQEKTRPDFFKEVDETIYWEMEFPGGFVTTGKSSYNHDWSYLNVVAEHGKFGLGPAFGYGEVDGYTSAGPMDLPQVIHQAVQMDDFAQCVWQNKQSRVPGEEGLKDMKVVDAIYRSLDSGKKEKIV